MNSNAIISNCGKFRYALTRRWGTNGKVCVFIMLNPSTADAFEDDPTIRRCVGFAKRLGCDGLRVVNLFAYRATHPHQLPTAADPIGPENDRHIEHALRECSGPVIAAWGSNGALRGRGAYVKSLFQRDIYCLGLTNNGQPKHPLYIKGDTPLVPFFNAPAG